MTNNAKPAMLYQMAAKPRPGRKRVTTSFTLPPELHKKLEAKFPQRGLRSKVLEELIQALCDGKIKRHPAIGFYGSTKEVVAA